MCTPLTKSFVALRVARPTDLYMKCSKGGNNSQSQRLEPAAICHPPDLHTCYQAFPMLHEGLASVGTKVPPFSQLILECCAAIFFITSPF
eukprot:359163-Pelagomonas_calceolata.AAC.2